jgi:Flp pilus assembly protein TadG
MRRIWAIFQRFTRQDTQHGQSIILVAVGVFTLLAFVGLAVDLGIYYSERVKIVRAVDAAALAAAPELPLESAAHTRALEFLRDNGYDSEDPGDAGGNQLSRFTILSIGGGSGYSHHSGNSQFPGYDPAPGTAAQHGQPHSGPGPAEGASHLHALYRL